MSPGTLASRRDTSVDFPEPDGAEMMKTVVMGSRKIYRRDAEEIAGRATPKTSTIPFLFLVFLGVSAVNSMPLFQASIPSSATAPESYQSPISQPGPDP